MGIIRDFSQSSIESIREIIRENVDEEDQWAIVDWFDDMFTDDVDINDYINDVASYQAIMVDKHDISGSKFDEILQRVHTVDYNYAQRYNSVYTRLLEFYNKIVSVSAMLSPEAIALGTDEYQEFLEKMNNQYDEVAKETEDAIEQYKKSMPRLDDPEWYEKVLNAAEGVATSALADTYEGIISTGALIYLVTGQTDTYMDCIEGASRVTDRLDDLMIEYVVSDKESYYFGRCVGDVTMGVIGAVSAYEGIGMIGTGLAGLAGGTAVTSTGALAPAGIVIDGASVLVLAEGIAVSATGACVAAASVSNFDNNLDHMKSANDIERPDTDSIKNPEEVKNGEIKDIKDTADNVETGGYTGGRSQEELDSLAKDPAHSGSTRRIDIEKGQHEADVGLDLESRGLLDQIERDPTGKAEFIDGNGQAWDVKSFNSNYKPKKGGFTLDSAMKTINKSLAENENVIIDTSNMTEEHIKILLEEVEKQGLLDRVLVWP